MTNGNIWEMASMKQKAVLKTLSANDYEKIMEQVHFDAEDDLGKVPDSLKEMLGV